MPWRKARFGSDVICPHCGAYNKPTATTCYICHRSPDEQPIQRKSAAPMTSQLQSGSQNYAMSNPEEATKSYHRGIAQEMLEEYQKAIGEYDRAIQLNPDYAEAYCRRGITNSHMISQGADPFKIMEYLYYALALNPSVDGADQAKRILKAFAGDNYWEKTKEYVESIMDIYPENAPPSLVYRKQALGYLAQLASQAKTPQESTQIKAMQERVQTDAAFAKQFVDEMRRTQRKQ